MKPQNIRMIKLPVIVDGDKCNSACPFITYERLEHLNNTITKCSLFDIVVSRGRCKECIEAEVFNGSQR